jgi:hypothetical protein
LYLSRTPAPDLTPENVGEVVETRPQVDANAPSQLIREICARVSYPRASKSSSGANPRVAQKRTTPARARQGAAQGKGAARKKAPQGGKKRHRSSSRSSSSSSSSSEDSSVVSVHFFGFEIALEIFFCVVMNCKVFFGFETYLRSHYLLPMMISLMNGRS